MTFTKLVTVAKGWLGVTETGEVVAASTTLDPAKVRVVARVEEGSDGRLHYQGTPGHYSIGNLRPDESNIDDVATFGAELDERFRDPLDPTLFSKIAGRLKCEVKHPEYDDDRSMIRVLDCPYDERVLTTKDLKDIVAAVAALPANAPRGFRSDDGRYVYNVQGDPTPEFPNGRIVQYNRNGSDDPAQWTAVAILRPELL